MISEEQIVAWERLANEATEGPWHRCLLNVCTLCLEECCLNESVGGSCGSNVVSSIDEANLDFVAAAREAVPALIAEVRELRESLKRETKHLTISIHERLQFEKEAAWLAKRISITNICANPRKNKRNDHCGGEEECVKCWRKAARKAVQD